VLIPASRVPGHRWFFPDSDPTRRESLTCPVDIPRCVGSSRCAWGPCHVQRGHPTLRGILTPAGTGLRLSGTRRAMLSHALGSPE
jgi:hypothetical protein